MGLDEEGTAHLMEVLTNLYEDTEIAIIREYSTNALDSHVSARVKRPIRVSLPSKLHPVLTIQDWGLGLDRDDIANVFSKYGASTKRKSNLLNGTLGLGGKAGLAYTQQFNVIGIKNGERTFVSVSRTEEGGGTMTVMEVSETDEHNGVEIMLPIQNIESVVRKAREFFSYWKPGTVVFDKETPEPLTGIEVGEKFFLVERNPDDYWSKYENVVVMGGVPYDIPDDLTPFKARHHGFRLVAHVAIGDLDFTPNREGLRLNKKTKACLEQLSKEFNAALLKTVQADINGAESHPEALLRAFKWQKAIPEGHPAREHAFSYKREEIPKEIQAPLKTVTVMRDGKPELAEDGSPIKREFHPSFITTRPGTQKVGSHDKQTRIGIETFVESIHVHDYTTNFTPAHKRKLEKYIGDKSLSTKLFVLSDEPLDQTWIDPTRTASWDEIKDLKVPRKTENVQRVNLYRKAGTYDIYNDGRAQGEIAAEDIANLHARVFYYSPNEFRNGYHPRSRYFADCTRKAVEILTKVYPGCVVVEVGLNRIAKFKQLFPAALPVKAILSNLYDQEIANLSDEALEAHRLCQSSKGSLLSDLDYAKVDDPGLVKLIKLVKQPLDPAIAFIQSFEAGGYRENLIQHLTTTKRLTHKDKKDPALEKYTLLDELSNVDQPHTYIYLNAVYNAKRSN